VRGALAGGTLLGVVVPKENGRALVQMARDFVELGRWDAGSQLFVGGAAATRFNLGRAGQGAGGFQA
jgi:hypothetical protein